MSGAAGLKVELCSLSIASPHFSLSCQKRIKFIWERGEEGEGEGEDRVPQPGAAAVVLHVPCAAAASLKAPGSGSWRRVQGPPQPRAGLRDALPSPECPHLLGRWSPEKRLRSCQPLICAAPEWAAASPLRPVQRLTRPASLPPRPWSFASLFLAPHAHTKLTSFSALSPICALLLA